MAVRSETPLSREMVVIAALAIIDRDGISALSMRRLGETLQVSSMAMYHHFRDKEEILRGVSAHLLSGMDRRLPDPATVPCAEWLMAVARSYMTILSDHPKAVPVLLSHPFRARAKHEAELVLGVLRRHGIDPGDGHAVLDCIEAYCLGFGLVGSRPLTWLEPEPSEASRFPHLRDAQTTNPRTLDEEFELGARSLIDGLLARLGRDGGAGAPRRG